MYKILLTFQVAHVNAQRDRDEGTRKDILALASEVNTQSSGALTELATARESILNSNRRSEGGRRKSRPTSLQNFRSITEFPLPGDVSNSNLEHMLFGAGQVDPDKIDTRTPPSLNTPDTD